VGAAAHLTYSPACASLPGAASISATKLTDDLVTEPLHRCQFNVHLPTGPNIRYLLDEDKLRNYTRS
jgi:hypothetical protein